MANLNLEQQPKYDPFPATQDVIFTVSDNTVVTSETRVKFIANVYISTDKALLGTSPTLQATLKTTPNNAGVGMFDLRPILESFVKSDSLASGNTSTGAPIGALAPTYKGSSYAQGNQFPIHVIDKYALSENTIKWLSVKFQIEYLNGGGNPNAVETDGDFIFTQDYLFYNGYLSHTDNLTGSTTNSDFGWNLEKAGYNLDGSDISFIQNSNTSNYLTPCPKELHARVTDYGTLPTFNVLTNATFFTGAPNDTTNRRYNFTQVTMYDANNTLLVTFNIDNNTAVGGFDQATTNARAMIIFLGLYPANLNNWSSDFQTHIANTSYYTVKGVGHPSGLITDEYRINIICDSSFGYEGIRLTWLNKFGTWDYYTFNQKSIRSLSTSKTQYTQLGGTWNEATYQPNGFKGGMKNFRVNATEKITLNTDYLTDLESEWIESLFNSPEVYILTGETPTDNAGIINKYVQPVTLTTTSFTRKTKANDKLIQYTFEVERNRQLRTQTT